MISDDDLLLYYYREVDATERTRIGAALSQQPELARRLHSLVARLDAVAVSPEVPVPVHTQQRWQSALDRAARETRATPRAGLFTSMRWQVAAAAVAVVVLVFGIQKAMQPATNQLANNAVPASAQTPADAGAASAYDRGLKWHLASTEQQLASLEQAKPEERARLVEAIIGQNRIYALAAERAGEPQLARVLRAFTPILESVADGHAESTSSSIAQLSFELRIMQARLKAESQAPTNIL